MAKKTYIVTGCDIRMNGKKYPEGSEISLTDEEAKNLASWIRPKEASQDSGKGASSAADGEARTNSKKNSRR